MPRFDKYDPVSGGFRAPLAADWALADYGKVIGVGLDANGRVVKGAGVSGIKGVVCVPGQVVGGVLKSQPVVAGDIVDVMTSGEITDCTGLTAGTSYVAKTAAGDGTLATATGTEVGFTVEAGRLVVRATGKAVA